MATTTDRTKITTQTELLDWLGRRMSNACRCNFVGREHFDTDRVTAIFDMLNAWCDTYRYLKVAFENGEVHFVSLPACIRDLGTEIDVRTVDTGRHDLVALARGFV